MNDFDILNFLNGFRANKINAKNKITNDYIEGKISKEKFIEEMNRINKGDNNGNRN